MLIDGKTIEQFLTDGGSWDDLRAAGIVPVEKALLAALVKSLNYPHDKLEGLWLSAPNVLSMINDDDFGITAGENGAAAKTLDKDGREIEHSAVYDVEL